MLLWYQTLQRRSFATLLYGAAEHGEPASSMSTLNTTDTVLKTRKIHPLIQHEYYQTCCAYFLSTSSSRNKLFSLLF